VPAGTRRYFDYPRGKVDYLTHISRRHHAVFVEVPKAGCTVVKRVMRHSEHAGAPFDQSVSVHDRARSPLAAPLRDGFDLDEVFGPDGSMFRFSFVRNPYSRVLSCYLEKIAGEQWLRELRLPRLGFAPDEHVSLAAFLERVADQPMAEMDIHWAPQAVLLSLGRVTYDFLGRFESFHADLSAVIARVGFDAPEHLLHQRSAHTTNARDKVMEYYDDRTLRLVRHIYRADFDRLGYGRDPRFA
jgi:sulfotransferase famil protein